MKKDPHFNPNPVDIAMFVALIMWIFHSPSDRHAFSAI